MSLNPKQQRFVAEYLVDLNATQAAIRAGYSSKTADVQGPRLLGNAGVAAAIAEGQKAQLARAELTADWVVGRIKQIADFKITMLFDAQGNLLPVHQWPEGAQRAVCSIEVEQVGVTKECTVTKIRVQKSLDALDKLMRKLGQYRDQLDLNLKDQVTKAYGFDVYKGKPPAA